jgi:hypothetical protein
MGINRAEQSIEIGAPPQACFDAIVDYETFPEWQSAVLRTEVLDRYENELGKRVRLTVDARLRQVTYVLEYHYEAPGRLWWDFVEGKGVTYVDGEYLFEPSKGGPWPHTGSASMPACRCRARSPASSTRG